MKNIVFLAFLLAIVFIIPSCEKDCDFDNPVCAETPPTDEACLAYFERWFYDSEANKCEKIGYSGCTQKGFATMEECESCGCD